MWPLKKKNLPGTAGGAGPVCGSEEHALADAEADSTGGKVAFGARRWPSTQRPRTGNPACSTRRAPRSTAQPRRGSSVVQADVAALTLNRGVQAVGPRAPSAARPRRRRSSD